MSQHDYVIDNAPGLAVRADLNAAFQALATMNSGVIEPQTMYPGMFWLDLSGGGDGVVRCRNQLNDDWIPVPLSGGLDALNTRNASDLASNTTLNLDSVVEHYVDVTGNVNINSVSLADGKERQVRFTGTPTVTAGPTLVTSTGTSVKIKANDYAVFRGYPGGVVYMFHFTPPVNPVPLATVLDYAGLTEPTGWLFCYGQAIDRADFAALFALIGTTYGVGNNTTTFNLPDARGRVVAGRDNMGGVAASRITLIAGTTLGANGGAQSVALTVANLPAHAHAFTTATENAAHTHSGGTGGQSANHQHGISNDINTPFSAGWGYRGSGASQGVLSGFATGDHSHAFVTGTENQLHAHSGTTNNAGSDTAHSNLQPTLILNKIIKVVVT